MYDIDNTLRNEIMNDFGEKQSIEGLFLNDLRDEGEVRQEKQMLI